ncbi:MAG: carbamoyl phosphate synthase small subunit, partial [Deltaproteobacteria bacterium]
FVVDLAALPKSVELTHLNLNDHTVEGIADPKRNFFSVQYHPEASPGPHDSTYLFKQFRDMMENHG